mmetsp:Transcript_11293/g.27802  ORF Transcript_11293/g.27802 Transcript_11293/m.27802 type:complete len:376 (-) Transcript_11293:52-1179(-)
MASLRGPQGYQAVINGVGEGASPPEPSSKCTQCWAVWSGTNVYLKTFISLALYFAFALVCYSQTENWSLLDTCYFLSITLSTVGYGDIAPKTTGGKICTIFIIFLGIFLVGSLLADLFESMFDAHQAVFLQELRELDEADEEEEESKRTEKRKLGLRGLLKTKGEKEIFVGVLTIAILFLSIYALGILWSMFVGGLSFLDALYFTTVTISTVGYGDNNASNMKDDRDSKIFSIFFVAISVFSFGAMITTSINLWAGYVRRKKMSEMIDEKITCEDFNRFLEIGDANYDSRIDMAEFAFICLDELGLLSPTADMATLLAIQHEFRQADKSKSGFIDRHDVAQGHAARTLRRSLKTCAAKSRVNLLKRALSETKAQV